jgi:ketosteroid isomerase-like protein
VSADTDAILDLAERFFTAVERGDLEAVRALYAPEALIWHNHDGKEQTVEQNLRVLAWVARHLPGRRYRVRRRVAIPGGFLQQHVLEGETRNGPFSMPACIVCEVAGGRITRLEEYLDSAQAGHLRGLTSGPPATSSTSTKFTP